MFRKRIKPILIDCEGAKFETDNEQENALLAAHVLNHCLNIPVSSELDARITGDVGRDVQNKELESLERWSMKVVQPAMSARLGGAILDNVTVWGTTMKLEFKPSGEAV